MENEKIRKDETKGKIVLFVIGVLLGAVIASAAFLICVNTLGVNNSESSMQMPGGGTPPEMPGGNSQNSENSQSGDSQSGSSQSAQNQPPEKPSNNNQSSENE